MDQYGGRFPEDPNQVRELPGFGEYTTAAVLSLSRGQDLAVLDGNVARVLSRVFLVSGDTRTGPVRRRLQAIVDEGLPPGRAGQYNEALMELGATVCRPRPDCDSCPLSAGCGAFREGRQTEFPNRAARPTRPCFPAVVLVGRRADGRVLLHRRTGKRLLGGLWELPVLRGEQTLGLQPTTSPEVEGLCQRLMEILPFQQVANRDSKSLPFFRHHYSHFSVELHPVERELRGDPPDPSWRWVSPADRDGLGISASDRRILDGLLD